MQGSLELRGRIEQLEKGPTPLQAAVAKQAELQADKAKFLDHIAGLEACPHGVLHIRGACLLLSLHDL